MINYRVSLIFVSIFILSSFLIPQSFEVVPPSIKSYSHFGTDNGTINAPTTNSTVNLIGSGLSITGNNLLQNLIFTFTGQSGANVTSKDCSPNFVQSITNSTGSVGCASIPTPQVTINSVLSSIFTIYNDTINGHTGHVFTIDNVTINGNIGQKFTIQNTTINGHVGQVFTIDNVTINRVTGQKFTIDNFTLNGEYGPHVSITNVTGYLTLNHNNAGVITPSFGFKVNSKSCPAGQFIDVFSNSTDQTCDSPTGLVKSVQAGLGINTNQTTGNILVSNTGVLSNNGGTGITTNATSGNTLITNSGVISGSGTSGNITTSGTNPLVINTSWDIPTLSGIETFLNTVTFNSLKLGGDENVGSNALTNLGHKSTIPLTSGLLCQTNQTTTCGTGGSGTVTGSQNVGRASGSVGVLSTASPTTIKGMNMSGVLGNVTISKTNTTDILFNTGNNLAYIAKKNNFTTDNTIATTKKLGFDVSSSNYITSPSAGSLSFFASGNEAMRIFPDGTISIGNFTGASSILNPTSTVLQLIGNSTTSQFDLWGFGANPTQRANRADGTAGSPTALLNGENIFSQSVRGYDGSSFGTVSGNFRYVAVGDWNTTSHGTKIDFRTTPSKSTGLTTVLSIMDYGTLQLVPITDPIPTKITNNDFWWSSTNADVLKYRSGGTTYNIGATGLTQTWTGDNIFTGNVDFHDGGTKTDKFDSGNIVIRNPLATFGTTIANSAILGNRTLNLPLLTQTETIAVTPVTNQTTGHNGGNSTGTTSAAQVMLGNYGTITPTATGNIRISVSGYWDNSIVSDGCRADVRIKTSNMGANGAALTGTLVGTNFKMISSTASGNSTFSKTVVSTGNTVGTKLFVDLSFNRITGGTCTIRNVDLLLQEY